MQRCVLALSIAFGIAAVTSADNWPAWRGAGGQGVCHEKNLPLTWSPTENIRWKTKLPGHGNSTPIVWENRVFITQALDVSMQKKLAPRRALLCFDRKNGELLWQKTVEYKEPEETHGTNPYCSASPATDGERVVVSHGSAGVFCYDLEGKELWKRDLGKFDHIWGNAASPVLYKDLVILNCGPGPRSFLLAMNKQTGDDVWKIDEVSGRDGYKEPATWSTPIIVTIQGQEQLIMTWGEAVKAYVPATGELLWTCKGLGKQVDHLVYTSPLATSEVVVAMSGFGGSYLAVKTGGKGDVTDSHRLWRHPGAPQRIGSGVIIGEHVYIANAGPGTFQCIEWKTGKILWTERLGDDCWGSIVHANDRLYVTDLRGDTHVLSAKPVFERLAKNALGERTLASPAVSNGDIFIRTYQHLWCVGTKAGAT
jgi:outer membrane protein assembly factor BamB